MSKHKRSNRFHTIFWAIFALVMFVLDLSSKWIVQSLCNLNEPYQIIKNFLYVRLSHNTGAAFSLGAGSFKTRIFYITISTTVSIVIAVYYFVNRNKNTPLTKAILSLMFAGALGNLIDRAFYWESTVGFSGVIDFIQFYLGGGPSSATTSINPFATFNWADSCLTIGVCLFALQALIEFFNESNSEDLSKDPRLKKEENKSNE